MKQKERNGLRLLSADEGMSLIRTNEDPDSICDVVYLGTMDCVENWKEITITDAELYKQTEP